MAEHTDPVADRPRTPAWGTVARDRSTGARPARHRRTGSRRRTPPQWHRPTQAARLILTGATAHVSVRIALIVGSALTVVNQAGVIWHHGLGPATTARVVANYCIPYLVSGVGYLMPYRRATAASGSDPVPAGPTADPPRADADPDGRSGRG